MKKEFIKVNKEKNRNPKRKTWLELTDKELKLLKTQSACMYGAKTKPIISIE